jgi:hypothetical protein
MRLRHQPDVQHMGIIKMSQTGTVSSFSYQISRQFNSEQKAALTFMLISICLNKKLAWYIVSWTGAEAGAVGTASKFCTNMCCKSKVEAKNFF